MTNDETPEPSRSVQRRLFDALPDAIASAATGVLDLATTGTPSAGVAAPLLAALVRYGLDVRSSRGERVLEATAEQVGGLDRLADLATADEARLELTVRVIEAAMRTTHENKIRALGRVLANGLDGHATVDQSQILTAALDAIEAPHVQVLAVLREQADGHETEVRYADRAKLLTLTNTEIVDRLPGHRTVLGAVTQVLAGHHLIEPVSGGVKSELLGGPGRWAITDLGRACLARLEEA
ncbi:hypothetical protein OF117_08705 [Geodermatophilus sp. YIM 151500]|uniref:hypothetical protein n=1 Tax=Geodermatophilus sp. YIM 151500 TaxID=2984531 RepID=UPI0021E4866D|nr:hypothetical protein [Geodermatophilus sp. YIM 151500]MCV2489447.1 hypothetical protein [Geodermatophilus sp. YIM 151500]